MMIISHQVAPHPSALLRARRERPSSYTATDKCDEVPPPHGAYPKAKDHELIIAPCIAARSGKFCPLWVISGEMMQEGRAETLPLILINHGWLETRVDLTRLTRSGQSLSDQPAKASVYHVDRTVPVPA